MKLGDLVTEIIRVSEKAACLARAVSAEESLFKLLVEEKTGEEKNKRFLHDFKTLADVLVQETVSHDLTSKFPSLAGNIHGEESNTFTNTLGESVTIQVRETTEDTAKLLNKVLNGNTEAATLLAKVIHQDVVVEITNDQNDLETCIPDDEIGLWIDPIDSTSQYIRCLPTVQHETGLYTQGLQSVLVLIGVYSLSSGNPIIGVINQPFTCKDPTTNSWKGTYWWGVCYNGIHANSVPALETGVKEDYIVISSSESSSLCDALSSKYIMVKASGGGYKLLCVIQNLVPVFFLTKASCYKWDTCSPHAILLSLGGGVLDLNRALDILNKNRDMTVGKLCVTLTQNAQLKYNHPDTTEHVPGEKWCNSGGVLAYRNINTAVTLLQCLAKA